MRIGGLVYRREKGVKARGSLDHDEAMRARERLVAGNLRGLSVSAGAEGLMQQRGWALVFWNLNPDFCITFWAKAMSYGECIIDLRKLGALLDRYFLGPNWCRYPPSERTEFVAILERGAGADGWHAHVLVKLPPKALQNPLASNAIGVMLSTVHKQKHIFRRGDIKVKRLTTSNECESGMLQSDTACYVAKDLYKPGSEENVVFSSQFHPSPGTR